MSKREVLRIKIYDVEHGDCILIQFPNGEIGLVDSNLPSGRNPSPALKDIIEQGGKLKFICLTHPHHDHFAGLMSILESEKVTVGEFWHSMSFGLESILKFYNERSIMQNSSEVEFITKKRLIDSKNGELLDIFDHLAQKGINYHKNIREFQILSPIGGVNILALSPSNRACNKYEKLLSEALKDAPSEEIIKHTRDYANRISIVLLLKFDESEVLLGGDALKQNWKEIIKGLDKINRKKLAANCIKVSHHASKDSFEENMWSTLLKENSSAIVSCGLPHHPSTQFIYNLNP